MDFFSQTDCGLPVHFVLSVSICFTVVEYLEILLCKFMIECHSKDLSNFLLLSGKEVVVMTPLFKLLLKIFSFKLGLATCQ